MVSGGKVPGLEYQLQDTEKFFALANAFPEPQFPYSEKMGDSA